MKHCSEMALQGLPIIIRLPRKAQEFQQNDVLSHSADKYTFLCALCGSNESRQRRDEWARNDGL
jgi:hypothetical protein